MTLSYESLGWGTDQKNAFYTFKCAMKNLVTLFHVCLIKDVYVYTVAYDIQWAGVVTQTLYDYLSLSIQDQKNGSLVFLSGHFCGAEPCWLTTVEEAYTIVTTMFHVQ